jgi:hypothetical protein
MLLKIWNGTVIHLLEKCQTVFYDLLEGMVIEVKNFPKVQWLDLIFALS